MEKLRIERARLYDIAFELISKLHGYEEKNIYFNKLENILQDKEYIQNEANADVDKMYDELEVETHYNRVEESIEEQI